jgi:hypothetical protein
METQVKIYPVRTTSRDLNYELIEQTINKIKEFVKENDYQFKAEQNLEAITKESFNGSLLENSKRKRKKLAALIWGVNEHPTLERVSKFFHFLTAKFMKISERVKIEKSEKELSIQNKKKAYKAALKELEESEVYKALIQSRADYKTEKGDFYKIRLSKGKKI